MVRDQEIKLEEDETSHTLTRTGEETSPRHVTSLDRVWWLVSGDGVLFNQRLEDVVITNGPV